MNLLAKDVIQVSEMQARISVAVGLAAAIGKGLAMAFIANPSRADAIVVAWNSHPLVGSIVGVRFWLLQSEPREEV